MIKLCQINIEKYFFDIFGYFCPSNFEYLGISNKSARWLTPFLSLFKNACFYFEIILGKYLFIHFGSTEPCG